MNLTQHFRIHFVSHYQSPTLPHCRGSHQPLHSTWVAEKHKIMQKPSTKTENRSEPLFMSPTGNESELFCWIPFWWELKLSWNNSDPAKQRNIWFQSLSADLKISRTVRNKRLLNGSFLTCFLSNPHMNEERCVGVTTCVVWLTVYDCWNTQKKPFPFRKLSCFLKISLCTSYLLWHVFTASRKVLVLMYPLTHNHPSLCSVAPFSKTASRIISFILR